MIIFLDEAIIHPPLAHVVQKRGTFGDLIRGFLYESSNPSPTSYRQGRQTPSVSSQRPKATVQIPLTTSTPGSLLLSRHGLGFTKLTKVYAYLKL